MIQISNLIKKYGETVIFSNLNYTFENTCIYGLVGRNGAGKTTLLNILSNYDKNYTGVISIDGEKMNKVDYPDMPVAYAMDQPIFFNNRSKNSLTIGDGMNCTFEHVEYSCAMKSHFRKFGNQMSGSGNHLCNYASLLA